MAAHWDLDNSKLAEAMDFIANYYATFLGVPKFKYEIKLFFHGWSNRRLMPPLLRLCSRPVGPENCRHLQFPGRETQRSRLIASVSPILPSPFRSVIVSIPSGFRPQRT